MKLNAITTDITFGTNILDIEVPEHLTRKFRTGLSFVDGAMGGQGFTPSSVTLFTGTPGAGKTTLMLTLADAATKQGATVLFNTAEESLYQTAMTAKRLRLKHGFDAHMHLSVEEKDEDFKGCRILETQKNRFGGCGHMFYLALRKTGFREVAKIEEF